MRSAEAVQSRDGGLMDTAGFMDVEVAEEGGRGAQGRQNPRGVRMAYGGAVFIIGAVADVVITVFDAPMSPADLQQPFAVGRGLLQRLQRGNRVSGFLGQLPLGQDTATDANGLCGMRKADLFRTDRYGPQLAPFQTAMGLIAATGLWGCLRGKTRYPTDVGRVPARPIGCL